MPDKIAGGLVVVDPTKLAAVAGAGVDHIVMKASSGAPWSAIEPQMGVYNWQPIYNYLNAYPNAKITLRIQAGEDAPGWLKAATGTVGVYNKSRGANVVCCLWWTQLAMDSWTNMINAAGAQFDSNPRVIMVSADLPMSVYSEPFILGSDTQTGINLFNLGCNETTQTAVIKRCVNDTVAAFPNTLVELAIHSDMQIPISTGIEFSWPKGRQILVDLANIHGERLVFSDYGLDGTDTVAAHPITGTINTEPNVYAWLRLRAGGAPAPWAGPVSIQLTVGTLPQTQAIYVSAAEAAISHGAQMCETAGWGLLGSSEATRLDTALKAKALLHPFPAATEPPVSYDPVGVFTGGNDGGTGATATYTLTEPAGVAVDDLMLVKFTMFSTTATASISSGSGQTWTVQSGPDLAATGVNSRSYVWSARRLPGDTGQPVVVTVTGATPRGLAVGIELPPGTVRASSYATVGGGLTSLTQTGLAGVAGDVLIQSATTKANSGNALAVPTMPTGYTLDKAASTNGSPATNFATSVAHAAVTTTGTVGADTWTYVGGSANGGIGYAVTVTPDPTGVAYSKAVADTLALTDSLTVTTARSITLAELVGALDALSVSFSRGAGLTDGATGSDSLALTSAAARQLADGASGSDAISAARDGSSPLADAAPAADFLLPAVSRPRPLADAAPAADDLTAERAIPRGLSDSASVSDALTVSSGLLATPADLAAAGDAILATISRAGQLADAADAADAIFSVLSRVVTVTDTLALLDSISTSLSGATGVSLNDGAAAGDAVALTASRDRPLADAADAADSLTSTRSTVAVVADPASAADSVSSQLARVGVIADTLALTDSLTVTTARSITLAEALSATDALSLDASGNLSRSLSEAASASDELSATIDRKVTLADAASVSDAISAAISASLSPSDAATALDSVGVTMSRSQAVSDLAGIGDLLIIELAGISAISTADLATAGDRLTAVISSPNSGTAVSRPTLRLWAGRSDPCGTL